jgi:hypothetical protein
MLSPRSRQLRAWTRLPMCAVRVNGFSSLVNATNRNVRSGAQSDAARANSSKAAMPEPLSFAPDEFLWLS